MYNVYEYLSKYFITIEKIVSSIDLKVDGWKNLETTNCYAFALGLDIKEKLIDLNAFQPGMFAKKFNGLSQEDINKLKIYQRMLLDLEVLGISCEEYDVYESIEHRKDYLEWKIALFLYVANNKMHPRSEYHFMRQGPDDTWYHKFGYTTMKPNNTDANNNIVTDPKLAYFERYKYFKCYKLSIKKQ